MSQIAWLALSDNLPNRTYGEFKDFIRDTGNELLTVDKTPPINEHYINDIIENADGYIINDLSIIGVDKYEQKLLHEIKSNNKRLLCLPRQEQLNQFLINFDIGVESKRIKTTHKSYSDESSIKLKTKDQKNALAQKLGAGQKYITINHPYLLWYGKNSTYFLDCSNDAKILNQYDYFENLDSRLFACGAKWPLNPSDECGAVIVISGDIHCNPVKTIGGHHYNGLRNNFDFLENLIDWLTYNFAVDTDQVQLAKLLFHNIEVNLFDIVRSLMQKEYGEGWWEYVPEKVKNKSESNRKEDRADPLSGLYFVDSEKIMKDNWQIFVEYFGIGENKGKNSSLDWIGSINTIRKRLAHPIKQENDPITSKDIDKLSENHRKVKEIHDQVV